MVVWGGGVNAGVGKSGIGRAPSSGGHLHTGIGEPSCTRYLSGQFLPPAFLLLCNFFARQVHSCMLWHWFRSR